MKKGTRRKMYCIKLKKLIQQLFAKAYLMYHKTKVSLFKLLSKFLDSFLFYMIIIGIISYGAYKILSNIDPSIYKDFLFSYVFAVTGIIGASIAIVFMFSTFILQSTADLFSTQYLNRFIENKKEKLCFWGLVLLTVSSLLTPLVLKSYWVIEALLIILLFAFYIIYTLFKDIRKRMNPETTLLSIKNHAIYQLKSINHKFNKLAKLNNHSAHDNDKMIDYSPDVYYRSIPQWSLVILKDVDCLHEIGLRLLSKNEINSFNLTVKYIHDIYLEHLGLRDNIFIRIPTEYLGVYTVDDQEITSKIFEYFQSIGHRLIAEKRKENIYYLLKIYDDIISHLLDIKFADNKLDDFKGNPLLNLGLGYYAEFIEKLITAEENDWVWESIKSLSKLSNILIHKTDDSFVIGKIIEVSEKLLISSKGNEAYLKTIVAIYFDQILFSWNKHEQNNSFWHDLFDRLKTYLLILSANSKYGRTIADLITKFNDWQEDLIKNIYNQNKQETQDLKKYLLLLSRWSDFLLDFAGSSGFNSTNIGLFIIQSIENNLYILQYIKSKYPDIELDKVYRTQMDTLSWYFHNVDKFENISIYNLDIIFKMLLKEINDNLKNPIFEINYAIERYANLVERYFEKCTPVDENKYPRIIMKLFPVGLILEKYKKDEQIKIIVNKIEELTQKYLELYKDEYRICQELKELEQDIFSTNRNSLDEVLIILKQEITTEIWDNFVNRLSLCKSDQPPTIE